MATNKGEEMHFDRTSEDDQAHAALNMTDALALLAGDPTATTSSLEELAISPGTLRCRPFGQYTPSSSSPSREPRFPNSCATERLPRQAPPFDASMSSMRLLPSLNAF